MTGPRHPGTQGNELHPSDVKFPNPSGGDGRISLKNDVAAEFSALALSNTRPDNMPDGGLWVNLGAEPTGIDRLQTYDASTDAFIPITADQTIVAENRPEPQRGLLWFEPVDGGSNLYAASSNNWEFLQFIPAIPDNLVDNFELSSSDPAGPYDSGQTLSDYYSGYGDGLTFSRSTSNVVEGSQTVKISSASKTPGHAISVPGDGLPRYPDNGETVGWLCRETDSAYLGLSWGTGDSNGFSGYVWQVSPSIDNMYIHRWDNNTRTDIASDTFDTISLNTGEYYWIESDMPDINGNMALRVYNLDSADLTRGTQVGSELTATDTNYVSSRGIGFTRRGDVTGGQIDWIRIL